MQWRTVLIGNSEVVLFFGIGQSFINTVME